ncbi:MAG: peptidase [Rubritepida sp.]|nr:peptidase [Rubritepida sp.]
MKPLIPTGLDVLLRGAGAPRQALRIPAPDISRWRAGNVIPGVWSFDSGLPGQHVCIVGLTHGNEIAGAILLDRFLREKLRPIHGRLTLILANLDAFSRFDPDDPTASRFLEEDLNRVWDIALLDGPRRSCELRRARALRPVLDTADVILDLHSMLWPSDPLFLVSGSPASVELAAELGVPPLVVADEGHATGRRIIDYGPFSDPASGRRAILLEAGWHWEPETVVRMEQASRRLLARTGLVPATPFASLTPPRVAHVTRTVTARSADFTFTQPWRGGVVIPQRGTLIATDGDEDIRTPHDDCMLVMPSLLAQAGQTAVRMARI